MDAGSVVGGAVVGGADVVAAPEWVEPLSVDAAPLTTRDGPGEPVPTVTALPVAGGATDVAEFVTVDPPAVDPATVEPTVDVALPATVDEGLVAADGALMHCSTGRRYTLPLTLTRLSASS